MHASSRGVDVVGAGPVVVEVATVSGAVVLDVVVDVVVDVGVTGVTSVDESAVGSALWQATATTMSATPIETWVRFTIQRYGRDRTSDRGASPRPHPRASRRRQLRIV
jgi:hypothetical protein